MADAKGWREWWANLGGVDPLPALGQSVDQMRIALRSVMDMVEGAPPELAELREVGIPTPDGVLRGRLYVPLAAGVPPGPACVFYHGGGFVIGDLDSHDRLCRRLAATARVRLLSVDYRLAPAHPFPAALNDALAAFDWASGAGAEELGFDPARVAVAGDSAGGNLTAAVCQARRQRPGGPAFQVLAYPWMQLAETNMGRLRVTEGHLLSTAIIDTTRRSYLGDTDPMDPRVSPLMEQDLSGIAPAHVITCGLDPLGAEGRAYAERLTAAGVRVTHRHHEMAVHGFLQFSGIAEVAVDALDEACEAMSAALTA